MPIVAEAAAGRRFGELKRLMENKWKFSETDRTHQALANYKSKNSSALAFVQDACVVAPEAECFRQDLYYSGCFVFIQARTGFLCRIIQGIRTFHAERWG